MSSSSSSTSPQKPDQKLKSAVVTVEEKETMNNPEQRSSQAVVCENTIPPRDRDNVLIFPPRDNHIHPRLFFKEFQSRYALAGQQIVHRRDQDLEVKQPMIIDSMLSGGTSLSPFQSFPLLPHNKIYTCRLCKTDFKSRRALGGHMKFHKKERDTSVIDPHNKTSHTCRFCKKDFESRQALGGHMNCHKKERELEKQRKMIEEWMLSGGTHLIPFQTWQRLTLGPCKSDQGSSSHALSTDGINLDLTLGPSKSTGGSNNSTNNNTNSSFHGNLMISVGPCVSRDNFVAGNQVDSSNIHVPAYPTTDLCYDFFALQEHGSGSSHSKSLISKGKNKVMVPEDDEDIGMIRWLPKKKRSRGE
ncbi:hypothetical protein AXX17_AT5G53440 [Arabidopsis thaliana]|uniref:C2H2-type domain-containing protein n=1 Tax=Arabidopsis thaliana TaxID=3702 RepID=A0A178UCS8_ARATH|nr:hypothetical protein AXX17_AT5G53440 [Arabidopsis thaliana]